ncbi:hypothetical protein RUM44_010945 [Polyplax serrata]|uniref:Uncharacterized protein n=1 Tax=Polyplax serrata TaxID=468196 RepID=A0ABR1ANM8_POLSC
MEPETGHCTIQPNIIFLVVTLLVTAAATAILCASIMTENWEYITWDRDKLKSLEKEVTPNGSSGINANELEWLLDGQVVRVPLETRTSKPKLLKEIMEGGESSREQEEVPSLFLVPVHGGIWSFCIAVTGEYATISLHATIC